MPPRSFAPRAPTLAGAAALAPTLALALALPLLACGSSQAPVSSTTTSHKRPDYVPPPPDTSVDDTAADAPLPPADDPAERVAFTRAGSIFLMDARGGDERRVTVRANNAPDESPALSPHGDAIAFTSRRDGVSKIYVVSLDGTGSRAVTDGADGGDLDPAWSPDGRKLVFVRGRPEERRDLYILDFDAGGPPRRLLQGTDDDPARVGGPAWSPDGALIVFSADRGEGQGTGLWLIRPDGTGLRRLTRPGAALRWVRDLRPAWSPDGTRIAFASNRHVTAEADAGDLDLYDVTVDDGAITRLTRDPGVADEPSYSPDGKRLYFSSTREAPKPWSIEIYVMPARGGEQRRLTRDEVPHNAAPAAGRIRSR